MLTRVTEKKERSLGVKLFIKADRCSSPKCVTVRHPYRPGAHGQSRRRRPPSEYGRQLQEKQKIQITYGLNNRQMRNLFKKETMGKIVPLLETRLDRVVFLLGFVKSPRIGRQTVSHGHILVKGRKVTIPSYHVKVGDTISINALSRNKKIFEDLELRLKKYEPPQWLKLDKEKVTGECVKLPELHEINLPFDVNLVGQFYSR